MIKTNALDALHALLDADDDTADNNHLYARDRLIDESNDDPDLRTADSDAICHLIDMILDDRELLTTALLDFSLCPLHRIDYAICFDDDEPECAAIRDIHPSHDT